MPPGVKLRFRFLDYAGAADPQLLTANGCSWYFGNFFRAKQTREIRISTNLCRCPTHRLIVNREPVATFARRSTDSRALPDLPFAVREQILIDDGDG